MSQNERDSKNSFSILISCYSELTMQMLTFSKYHIFHSIRVFEGKHRNASHVFASHSMKCIFEVLSFIEASQFE